VAEIIYEYPATLDIEPAAGRPAGTDAIEWNITRVGAPDAWALGITGAGAVIGDLDTGVQWDHPALINQYRGNLGGGVYNHNYNWYDGGMTTVPTDYDTHGTHTMGTIVGSDLPSDPINAPNGIGVAPGARWIACPGIGSPYVRPFECFQFFLAPTDLYGNNPDPSLAPHVISNSWSSAGTDYHPAIQALYEAGIFFSKSAGNTGSACGTITNPGQWPEVTAAAAFANGDTIASFSSRGPVRIGYDLFVKPDIAAPGVGIRSAMPGNGYQNMQGTSMACPHVTGAVALLISANPALAGKIDVLQMLLKQNAEPKISAQCAPFVDRPNDVWGWGILDVHAAVLAAQDVEMGGIEGVVTDSSTSDPIEDAALTFEDANGWLLSDSTAADGTYSRPIPAGTYNVTANHYGYLPDETPGVAVTPGSTATLNIAMDPAPVWTVSGLVDEAGTGEPLAAHILFANTPVTADSDPDTGLYSAGVAQGTWWMDVRSPGHSREVRQVTVDGNRSEDFTLTPIDNYYMRLPGECGGTGYEWLDATGGTVRNLSDDSNAFVTLPNGRSFTFYGQTYTGLYVVSNGIVVFGTSNTKWSGPIPDPATPNNGIYAFSTDLNPASGSQGHIYTDYQQDRYFIVEWNAVQHFPSGDPETFQIILDLDTGRIKIQYQTVSNVADAVSGVENATGTEATQYAYADPSLIYNGAAVDFYPAFGTPPLPEGEVTGTVYDADSGVPIEGATVSAEAWSTGDVYTFLTDPAGAYAGVLCADTYTMTVSVPGYEPVVAVVVVIGGETVQQDFALVPEGFTVYLPVVMKNWP
jgi:subtilisin family serine protease